jgi:methylmalonyl-CoA mutase cobalamin-binding domain/chain
VSGDRSAVVTPRRQRRSLVVLAGDGRTSDGGVRALAQALADAGIDVRYLGREESAERIAVAAAEASADTVEFCVLGGGGIPLLRELLRELKRIASQGVSIIVHRVQ